MAGGRGAKAKEEDGDRMEQITKKDGQIYYGRVRCLTADDAYEHFRRDYHSLIGRSAFSRLDRLGQREERVHDSGFVFSPHLPLVPGKILGRVPVPVRLLGLVGVSYCRIIGEGIPSMNEDDLEYWLDYVLQSGSGCLRLVGKNDKAGRTSKLLNKRYR